MKALVIFNPHAHSGETSQRIAAAHPDILKQLQTSLALDSADWVETQRPGHATLLAKDAVAHSYDYIFAGGGDGTINEVLNGIMSSVPHPSHAPVFGVLPFGTSNDFFAALKIAEAGRNPRAHHFTMPLDIGQVVFDDLKRYFCLTAGLGFLSWTSQQYVEASQRYGRRFAHIPAVISAIFGYRFLPNARISENGKRFRARHILAVMIDNSPLIAGGTPLTPLAKIDDGYLDVCIIKPVSLPRLIWLALQIRLNAHTRSKAVILERITEITIITKQALPIHIDGELVPELDSKAKHTVIKVLPAALQVVKPSLCEFDFTNANLHTHLQ